MTSWARPLARMMARVRPVRIASCSVLGALGYAVGSSQTSVMQLTTSPLTTCSAVENSDDVKRLRRDPRYLETRFLDGVPRKFRHINVVTGLLSQDKGRGAPLEGEPLLFTNTKDKRMVAYYKLGSSDVTSASGDGQKVHEGLLATLLDDCLGRCGFLAMPNGLGVTAELDLTFDQRVRPGSIVKIEARVLQAKGRRAEIGGTLSIVDPVNAGADRQAVSATLIMAEPKWAKYATWVLR